MLKLKYIPVVFILLAVITHSSFAQQNVISAKGQNANMPMTLLDNKRLESLNKIEVETTFEAVRIKTALDYLAHILKEKKVNNVKIILLSEIDLSNQTTSNITFDTKITVNISGMSFLKALEVICEKARLEYVINEGTIIIGSHEVIRMCTPVAIPVIDQK